jgi:hypothetical protein
MAKTGKQKPKELGVLIVTRPETVRKRRYRSIRIPRAVYERVVRRLSVV